MIIVTGGAGFIGSCLVRSLNNQGRTDDIVIVDNIACTEKWKNLRNKKYRMYYHKNEFLNKLEFIRGVEAVIHLGACSSTTETNFDYLWKNNFVYTKTLWKYCAKYGVPFIYASSAATYGDGSMGFDDKGDIDSLRPLNAYGYSKQMFDQWVEHQASCYPPQYAGLKFFNVYGPNEYFKGTMASMAYHGYCQAVESGEIRLFESYHPEYEHGGQLRDFVYVKDVCDVILWLLCHKEVNGLFNVGTGRAQSFEELAQAVFEAMNMKPEIRYIAMPEHLKENYQYYTKADITKLREAGYMKGFRNVSEGVRDYVQMYLDKGFAVY